MPHDTETNIQNIYLAASTYQYQMHTITISHAYCVFVQNVEITKGSHVCFYKVYIFKLIWFGLARRILFFLEKDLIHPLRTEPANSWVGVNAECSLKYHYSETVFNGWILICKPIHFAEIPICLLTSPPSFFPPLCCLKVYITLFLSKWVHRKVNKIYLQILHTVMWCNYPYRRTLTFISISDITS